MSGFGGFGGSGFGQQNKTTGFGGFGSTNTGTGFGSTTNAGFGTNTNTTSGFGANNNTTNTGGGFFGSGATGSGFGSTGGGFGAQNSTGFGSNTNTTGGFGQNTASTSTGLFGGNTNPTGTGFGFGAGATNNTTSAFGSNTNTNTGGLFGAKPAFGSTTTTTPFGGSTTNNATSSFGAGNAFGAQATLGAGVGECTGTGSVPFQPTIEKEPNSSTNAQNSFQSITFQPPYQKFSPEELRLADYAQGRKYGNNSGQPGAFGTSTGFGGFGSNNNPATTNAGSTFGSNTTATTGLFGNSNSTPFGQNNTNTTGGVFGQKPATGGLFGNNSTPTTSGGLFGSTGFGANNNTTTTTTNAFGGTNAGSSLFGNNNQQQKPGFSFGATTNNATTGFGTNTGNNAFGQTNTSTSLFGGNNQQPQTNSPFSGSTFGNSQPQQQNSLFGNNAPKPGGLFGNTQAATPTTGGLFGNNTGAFGANNPQQSSLFGNNAAKPGGLFGNTTPSTGGLFGANQAQPQPQATSLFGNTANNQAKPLFGNTAPTTGLFGNTNAQPQGTSLFGGPNPANQQQPSNSLFGGSFGTPQSQQQAQSLTASINDPNAFGNSIFSSLGSTKVENPGPIATPLSARAKQKKSNALPLYKLSPASSSRFATPRRGYGFSYSTYGTPSSVSSVSSTPGNFGGSMLGQSLGPRLSKSMSASNLRTSFSSSSLAPDSILAPGAFSASPSARPYGSTGSMKKLVINRSIRSDLFSPPPKEPNSNGILKKRVSFDASTAGGSDSSNSSRSDGSGSPLKQVQNSSTPPTPEEMGYLRSSLRNGVTASVESPEPVVTGKELAVVPEEVSKDAEPVDPLADREPGKYWMSPTKEEILKMNRAQRQKISGMMVGRENCGQIRFDVPVDVTNVDLDDLYDSIVIISTREATVYPNPAKKPPVGKGLNVPSTIMLENSWPRAKDRVTPLADKSGPLFDRHLQRLKRVQGTKYVDYDKDKGIWTFTVEHYTTYGLDYSDDEETPVIPEDLEDPFLSQSPKDDTFDFKRKNVLPGTFDNRAPFEEELSEMEEVEHESFLDERSVGSPSESEPMDYSDQELVRIEDQEMVGSYPQLDATAEHDEPPHDVPQTPGAMLRARLNAKHASDLAASTDFAPGNDWMDMLSRTISPQKQDRRLLKSMLEEAGSPSAAPRPAKRTVSDGRGFATSIDLMNSLFDQDKSPKKSVKIQAKPKGFEWPYAKRSKATSNDMKPIEKAFHDSLKPRWGPDGTLVYAGPTLSLGRSRKGDRDGLLVYQRDGVVSELRDIHFAKFSNESIPGALATQKALTVIESTDGLPFAALKTGFAFKSFVRDGRDPASQHEKLVWELASVLFDDMEFPDGLERVPNGIDRLRKDQLSAFWQKLVEKATTQNIAMAKSHEEKAIASLSGHRIPDACAHLLAGRDYHLATLVPLIGGKASARKSIREQLGEWHKSKLISEFSQPIRAIYELLAGNVCVCDGTKAAPIEDRVESFVISQRFGLDWRQAFGLRLWYAILAAEPLEAAVTRFMEDLEQDRETARPVAWYTEQGIPTLWQDQRVEQREDLLWGLLKLYTSDAVDLESVLQPENAQLSPLDLRLSWQLSQALRQSGKATPNSADQLTSAFAAQLANEGQWLDAAFVLLHLESASARELSLQSLLARNASRIGSEDSASFTTLTHSLQIPSAWLWEAKALYMRSVLKDAKQEVECLLKAGLYDEAHRTFSRAVAPSAIVEQDYQMLRALLQGFQGRESQVQEWRLGGEVYGDFLELVAFRNGGGHLDYQILDRLVAALPAMVEENRHPAFLETVAVSEISDCVANVVVGLEKSGQVRLRVDSTDGQSAHLPKLLRLPLTEDQVLKHTVGMSMNYYQNLLSARA